jgi:hypothetical protein
MSVNEWKEQGFDGPNTPQLFCMNREVNEHNCCYITKLGKATISIQASHAGCGKKLSEEYARGLLDSTYLAVGAKIVVMQNIATYVGIYNGSTGIVKGIVYAKGVLAPSLPRFVIVDFGDMNTEPPFLL